MLKILKSKINKRRSSENTRAQVILNLPFYRKDAIYMLWFHF